METSQHTTLGTIGAPCPASKQECTSWLQLMDTLGAKVVVCIESYWAYFPNGVHIGVTLRQETILPGDIIQGDRIRVALIDTEKMTPIEQCYVQPSEVKQTIIRFAKKGARLSNRRIHFSA